MGGTVASRLVPAFLGYATDALQVSLITLIRIKTNITSDRHTDVRQTQANAQTALSAPDRDAVLSTSESGFSIADV